MLASADDHLWYPFEHNLCTVSTDWKPPNDLPFVDAVHTSAFENDAPFASDFAQMMTSLAQNTTELTAPSLALDKYY